MGLLWHFENSWLKEGMVKGNFVCKKGVISISIHCPKRASCDLLPVFLYPLCSSVGHRSLTVYPHSSWSWERSSNSFHFVPACRRSFFCFFFFGRLSCLLFPCKFQRRACLVTLSCCFLTAGRQLNGVGYHVVLLGWDVGYSTEFCQVAWTICQCP